MSMAAIDPQQMQSVGSGGFSAAVQPQQAQQGGYSQSVSTRGLGQSPATYPTDATTAPSYAMASPYTAKASQQYSAAYSATSSQRSPSVQLVGQPTAYQAAQASTGYFPAQTTAGAGQANYQQTSSQFSAAVMPQQYAAGGAQYTASATTGQYTAGGGATGQYMTREQQYSAQYTGQAQQQYSSSTTTTNTAQYPAGTITSGQQFSNEGYYPAEPVLNPNHRVVSRTLIGEERVREGSRYTVAGEQRVIETREFVDESRTQVVSEKVVEHEFKMPKKVIVEEIIERIVIIPERRIREEVVEGYGQWKEKIVEVAKPIIQEKIVEVPEIEYVEKIVEVAELIVQEKVKEVPRVEIQEKIVEVAKVVLQERVVEVPEIEYRDIPIERIEEQVQIVDQVVIKEIPVPQYVDKPVPEYVDVEEAVDLERVLPIPIEAITTYEFKLPMIRGAWRKVDVPLYVPRFVEIPLPIEMMAEQSVSEAEHYAQQIALLGFQSAVSLCELEGLAKAKHYDFQSMLKLDDLTTTVIRALQAGQLQVTGTFQAVAGAPPAGLLVTGADGYQQNRGYQQTTTQYQQTSYQSQPQLTNVPVSKGITMPSAGRSIPAAGTYSTGTASALPYSNGGAAAYPQQASSYPVTYPQTAAYPDTSGGYPQGSRSIPIDKESSSRSRGVKGPKKSRSTKRPTA